MMKSIKYLTRLFILLPLLTVFNSAWAEHPNSDILVVVNSRAELISLSRSEIRQIFMGGTLSRKYDAVTLPSGNEARVLFNTKVIGLTESRIQSYWAQLLFSGRNEPPKEFDSESQLLDYIAKVDNAIGYVSSQTPLPDDIVVVYKR